MPAAVRSAESRAATALRSAGSTTEERALPVAPQRVEDVGVEERAVSGDLEERSNQRSLPAQPLVRAHAGERAHRLRRRLLVGRDDDTSDRIDGALRAHALDSTPPIRARRNRS